ncbi:MAG: glycosyltransferase family 39 protein [Candidatus Omnitrophica bacterium]|nr:glycosyltransferase family 39 protein [Candidatus Omnitrophota bacterium]MBU4478030.1 glycosyltransferase family 39 protein [Candidatus Omnitrophota bacterium]MCG2703638.1 glycosyltransferase family 39 protein [Candidatus Omnitrophota bacterium]
MKKNNYSSVLYKVLFKDEWYLEVLFFLWAFVVRFAFLAMSDNFMGKQPMLNIITALHIFSQPALAGNISLQPLPFYLYSLAGAIALGKEQIFSARFLSLIFGSLCVIPFYRLVRVLFDRKIAFYSTLLLCAYPAHVLASILTLPDVFAGFFILWSLYFVVKRRIITAALMVLFAGGCSYAAWLCVPAMAMFIVGQEESEARKAIQNAARFFLIAAIIPLLWSILIARKFGEYGLFYDNFFVQESLYVFTAVFTGTIKALMRQLFEQPMPLIFLLSLVGIFHSARVKQYYQLIFVASALVILIGLGIFRADIPVAEEVTRLVSVLLVPYIVLGARVMLRLGSLREKRYMGLFIGLLILGLFSQTMYLRPFIPARVKQISTWLKKNSKDNDIICLEKDEAGYYTSIIMLSSLPQGNFCPVPEGGGCRGIPGGTPAYLVMRMSSDEKDFTLNDWKKVAMAGTYNIYSRQVR